MVDAPRNVQTSTNEITSGQPIDSTSVQNFLASHQYASEPTYFTRPNRYLGPSATWRSWTAADRIIANAIDQERSQDLAVHLYNAFALRKHARRLRGAANRVTGPRRSRSRSQSVGAGKLRADTRSDGHDDEVQFHVPDVWTAWPVPPEELATRGRDDNDGHDMLVSQHADRPSLDLEDGLIAEVLRHAKMEWQKRAVEMNSVPGVRQKRNWTSEREATKKLRAQMPVATEEDDDSILSGYESNVTRRSSTSSPSPLPGDGMNYFSSQVIKGDNSSADEDDSMLDLKSSQHIDGERPDFLADDDRARRILLPSVRHILSQLDNLLLALHKQRNAYAVPNRHDRDHSVPTTGSAENTDRNESPLIRSGAQRTSRSRSRQDYRGRKRKREQSMQTGKGNEYDEEPVAAAPVSRTRSKSTETRSRSRSRYHNPDDTYKTSQLGLRDWSDVLGMATLTGWNTEVVGRAAARCAKLFGENMIFRTFYEANSESRPYFEETVALAGEDNGLPVDGGIWRSLPSTLQTSDQQFAQREAVLMRVSERCSRCTKYHSRCEPAGLSDAWDDNGGKTRDTYLVPCRACLSLQASIEPCSGITAKPKPQTTHSDIMVCPYSSCSRHTLPFAKRYRLDRHLHTVHSEKVSSSTRPQDPPFSVRLLSAAAGLKCPVDSCPQSRRTYTRPTHLFTHVHREHPDIDLDKFKDLRQQQTTARRGRHERSSASASGSHRRGLESEGHTGRRTLGDFSAEEAEVDVRDSLGSGFEVALEREHEHEQHEINRENALPTHDPQLRPTQPDNKQEQQRFISRIPRDEDDKSRQLSQPFEDNVIIDGVPPAPSIGTAIRPLSNGARRTLNQARDGHFHSSDNGIKDKTASHRGTEEWHEGQDPLGEIDFEQFNTAADAEGENNDDGGDESF